MQPPSDFDGMFGSWKVAHHRLRTRLEGADDWESFAGTSSTRPILNGFGNLEENHLMAPDGAVNAVALRSFDPKSGNWAIWWLTARAPHTLDTPVKGRFVGPIGTFVAADSFANRPITVRFTWDMTDPDTPTWAQAFSTDDGTSWEDNWHMTFRRL